MKLTDFPRYVSPDQYSQAIDEMVDRLTPKAHVRSIYQIGSTGVPGVSDIDLLIVLKNGSEFRLDPRNDLTDTERYLFIHGLYGACESHFSASQQHTFFHNYRLLYGTQHEIGPNQVSEHELEMLKIQTAMEYLIQMYISSTVEKAYGIARIRGLLLHVKGLLYDLEFLNVHVGRLHDFVIFTRH